MRQTKADGHSTRGNVIRQREPEGKLLAVGICPNRSALRMMESEGVVDKGFCPLYLS